MSLTQINALIETLKTATGVNSVTPEMVAAIFSEVLSVHESSKEELNSSLLSLSNRFTAFLESADTSDATINRWKEIENFLVGVTDTETLSGLLEGLKTTLQQNINENTSAISAETTRATGVEQSLLSSINQETSDRISAIKDIEARAVKGTLYARNINSDNLTFRLYTSSDYTDANEFRSNYRGGEVGRIWKAGGDIGGILISSWHHLLLICSSYMIRFYYTDADGNVLPTSTTEGGYWRKCDRYTYHTYSEQASWNKVVEDFKAFLESADTSDATINRWKEIESFLAGITDTETLSGLLEELKTALQQNINENTSAISAETTRATGVEQSLQEGITTNTNNITTIKDAANYNTFCTTQEGNDIFKEVYIYPYVSLRNVSKITIEKGVTTESGTKKYQITFLDNNDKYSYIYLGHTASVIQGETISGTIQNSNNEGFGAGKTFYAVMDWSKISDGSSKTITTNFTSLINDSKYSPIITHVMQSYKFVKGSLGNAFIRELYLENLRKEEYTDDSLTSPHSYAYTPQLVPNTFILSNIARNESGKWVINFGAIYNGSFYPFKYETTENPESQDVIKGDILCWIGNGEVQYKATMYAVVDWTQIPTGEAINYGRPLLGGVVQKKLSPTISNYIEYGNKIEWSEDFDLNNYTTQGIYYISGERAETDDNLPIQNTGYISGQITVLDANGCVTQYLKLTNNGGSEGKEYIRTYAGGSWSVWRELKQTANLGQVTDDQLKEYVDNGHYEGAIVNSLSDMNNMTTIVTGFLQTIGSGTERLVSGTLFSMEVLNNYAITSVASSLMGVTVPRSITQVAKILLINDGHYDGTSYLEVQRTKIGDNAFGNWKLVNVL